MAALPNVIPFWGSFTLPTAPPAVREVFRDAIIASSGTHDRPVTRWVRSADGRLVCRWQHDPASRMARH
jgi:hypothetical protein